MAEDVRVIEGDALAVLPTLDSECAAAVVADPPYLIGANSLGSTGSKMATAADWHNAAFWYSAWLAECRRVLKKDGWVFVFGSWRSLPMMTLAISGAGLQLGSTVIWDKEWIGTGSTKGFRSSYEMIFVAHKGSPRSFSSNGRPDVVRRKWMACHSGECGHPAEKPSDLIADLITLSTAEGDLVVDPFFGSGTTGVACRRTGRRCLGIEVDPNWAVRSRHRLELAETPLFA